MTSAEKAWQAVQDLRTRYAREDELRRQADFIPLAFLEPLHRIGRLQGCTRPDFVASARSQVSIPRSLQHTRLTLAHPFDDAHRRIA